MVSVAGETSNPTKETFPELDKEEIVQVLEGYRIEAMDARKSGPNARDAKWSENLDLYWNRWDFSKKVKWQARARMPEVPGFVDRFAAAMKEALQASTGNFYSVKDDTDAENDIALAVKRATDVWLGRVGNNQVGQVMGFPGVFEEQMKLGALMSTCATVTWKKDRNHGRVAMESIDPRTVWLDHTGRGLYRIRRIDADLHQVRDMIRLKDSSGNPIFDLDQMSQLVADMTSERQGEAASLTGHGQEVSSTRKPITLDEYRGTVVTKDGKIIGPNAVFVVANQKFLVRGPERNPFWHKQDWLLTAPLVTVPLSPYGRSYMEDFGSIAKVFNDLTNILLDAVQATSLNVFALVPGLLINPAQANDGLHPNKVFLLEEGSRAEDFFAKIPLGQLGADAIQVWQQIKSELREAAAVNEIGLGQFAPKGRTSATEVNETLQSSSALIRSVADTAEQRFLNPALDMVWKVGLQHVSPNDEQIIAAIGKDLFPELLARRKEMVSRPITFAARGISSMLARARKAQLLLQALQIIGSNELFMQEFLRVIDPGKLVLVLMEVFGLDPDQLQLSEREKQIREIVDKAKQPSPAGDPGNDAVRSEASQAANLIQGL